MDSKSNYEMTIQGNETQACIDELKSMSPNELLVFAKLIKGSQVFAETCVHEASHAVIASLLDVPFDYVTVVPDFDEDRKHVRLGHVFWGEGMVGLVTRHNVESYALAVIAPRAAFPLFKIERTSDEAQDEFSGDERALAMFLNFQPKLTRPYLLKRTLELMTNDVRLWIYRVANELKDGKTLTCEDVRRLQAVDSSVHQ